MVFRIQETLINVDTDRITAVSNNTEADLLITKDLNHLTIQEVLEEIQALREVVLEAAHQVVAAEDHPVAVVSEDKF